MTFTEKTSEFRNLMCVSVLTKAFGMSLHFFSDFNVGSEFDITSGVSPLRKYIERSHWWGVRTKPIRQPRFFAGNDISYLVHLEQYYFINFYKR